MADTGRLVAPVVIIGAARSGTKMLRDLLARVDGFAAVPWDINYVWRFGNESAASDVLDAAHCRPEVAAHIRSYLSRYAPGGGTVIEKTVSNALRVPFVERVLPDARYIHLVRDGRDVAASALTEWLSPPNWRYVFAKARQYPLLSAPGYAMRQAWQMAQRLTGPRVRRTPVWGPAYPGVQDDVERLSLIEVCGVQWARCIEHSYRGFDAVPPERVLEVRYEAVVADPEAEFARIASFLDLPGTVAGFMADGVSRTSVGGYRRRLDPGSLRQLLPHIEPTLLRLGYPLDEAGAADAASVRQSQAARDAP